MIDRMKGAAPAVLRIGLALVFLWFGYMQLTNTGAWTGLIPTWVTGMSGLEASTLVLFNGSFEIVFGLCLFFGFFTWITSLLLALHMVHIFLTILMAQGLNGIAIRDFGLAIAAITLFMLNDRIFSIDNWLCTRYEQKNVQM
jgi:uncharacterized membrane protein YphA (DoxX/SURF4 family)